MLRLIASALASAALVSTALVAEARITAPTHVDEVELAPIGESVSLDSVLSIGATTTMNEHEAIVTAPGRGIIRATATSDVFCSGDETSRTLEVAVDEAGDVMLDFCATHLDRRDVTIRFVPQH